MAWKHLQLLLSCMHHPKVFHLLLSLSVMSVRTKVFCVDGQGVYQGHWPKSWLVLFACLVSSCRPCCLTS